VQLGARGGFRLAPRYFRHLDQVIDTQWDGGSPEVGAYFSPAWTELLGPPRASAEPLAERHADHARSLQELFEEVYFHVLDHAASLEPAADLCLAGGCAFNSVANGKVLARTPFRRLHIHPAAGDAGTAVGAAYWVAHHVLGEPRRDAVEHAYLGLGWADAVIRRALEQARLEFEWLAESERRIEAAVERLAAGEIVGWFQGREEWGPRALGNRSILADPRRAETKDVLNHKIKRRESFRPFAPAVPEERAGELFECDSPSPFMNQVYRVRLSRREQLRAVTHVDGSGRVQTVARASNPAFHRLIERFGERTGVPVLLNTSFNENEPIVHTPEQAVACFRRTGMDALVIGPALVRKGPVLRR
jgi:carbamoyltransferase